MFFLLVQHGQDLILGSGSQGSVFHYALVHHHQRRNADNLILTCQIEFFIHIDLTDLHIGTLRRDLIQNGADHPAGAAPGCPEVQQHRFVTVQNLSLEIISVNMFYGHIHSSSCFVFYKIPIPFSSFRDDVTVFIWKEMYNTVTKQNYI